ncbi:MAG TPA: DUF554 family protein [Verrucomicrobiota bacterium]|nr:DUF554 family protein [Verrucomicrobiota bacterium]
MLGTLINVAGIIFGALVGLSTGRNLPPSAQQQARSVFTALTVLTSLSLAWSGLAAPWSHALKQSVIAVVALIVGNAVGRALRMQRALSRLARWAATSSEPASTPPPPGTVPFGTQAIAFALNPLGIVGAVLAGWTGDWRVLALKAGLDALAALGFSAAGSRTVILAVIPLIAVQGTLTLLMAITVARFPDPVLAASLRITSGLLVLITAPVIFGWRQVPLANYLPALAIALLLAAWWF